MRMFFKKYITSRLLPALILASLPSFAETFDWQIVPYAYPGIRYTQLRAESPRPMDIFCIQVDTQTPGIHFYTTGKVESWVENIAETRRQTTRNFLLSARNEGKKMVIAINADAFSPWPAPYSKETLTNLLGLAVSDGVLVSPANNTPSFLVDSQGNASMAITTPATKLEDIHTAVSGFEFCLTDGIPIEGSNSLAPRTAIGLSEDRRYVFLLAIDGRRHASQGSTVAEVGEWLLYFGAHTGINMDGGGSTTLVRWNPERSIENGCAELLNKPVGNGVNWLENSTPELETLHFAPTERCNGNNLGVIINHLEFVQHPSDIAVQEGASVSLSVQVIGGVGALYYQWFKDGVELKNASNSPVLTIASTQLSDTGIYTCQVSDNYVRVLSRPGHLSIKSHVSLAHSQIHLVFFVVLAILTTLFPPLFDTWRIYNVF